MNSSKQWKRCSNCGHKGHYQKDCAEPKISIGIICFRYNINTQKLEFLLIRRKFTFAYTDFIRGNYETAELGDIISRITPTERDHILAVRDIKTFWDEIWTSSDFITEKFRRDYLIAVQKFNDLLVGPNSLEQLFEKYPPLFETPSWEFPKGKRDVPNESNVRCACREFYEETDIESDQYEILFDCPPVVEEFTGNNGVDYKYIYFVGQCHDLSLEPRINPDNLHQLHEIGDIGWFEWDMVKKKIRPKMVEDQQVFEVRISSLEVLYQNLCQRYCHFSSAVAAESEASAVVVTNLSSSDSLLT